MLLSRSQVTSTKPVISTQITEFQKAFFDEELLNEYREDGEEAIYLELFDHVQKETVEVQFFNKIIGFTHQILNSYPTELFRKTKALLEFASVKSCFVLSHIKLDFFGNRSDDFRPLVQAYEKLEKIVGHKTYTEAFQVNLENLGDLIEIFFWTVRCDPNTAEYIFFFDTDEQLKFNMCKYGNLHLTEFKHEKLTQEVLESLGWKVITGREYDQFTEDGGIEGRMISL